MTVDQAATLDTRFQALRTAAATKIAEVQSRQSASFMVPSMHCAGCMRTLENGLQQLDGVASARANLSLRQVKVVWAGSNVTPETIVEHIARLGFDSHLVDDADDTETEIRRQSRHLLLCLAVAGFAAANIMLLSVSVWSGAEPETARLFALLSGLIAVPAVFFAGSPFYASAWRALRARRLNMDVPISLAVLLSLFMSLYEALIGGGETFFDAGVMLLFFLLIGRTLDHLMRQKAASGVRSLARLIPKSVTRMGQGGVELQTDLLDVKPGMVLRLLPGDRFPVDAKVVSGSSTADRSVVTGETGDIPISIGDVFEAGTLNLSGIIEVEAKSDATTSFLAEVMELMKAAETSKGRYHRIADRMASIYAPAVHLLALITFVGWMAVTAAAGPSLTAAIAVLIITCPCALGLAVPVTHVVAAERLFHEGILMRDGSALERLAEAETVFFDKTGTLTDESLQLVKKPEMALEHEPVLRALADHSHHPVARAIAGHYPSDTAKVTNLREISGYGMEAIWRGKRVRFGRTDWVAELGKKLPESEAGSTCFAIEGQVAYPFDLKSDLKPDAVTAVGAIRSLGFDTAILSGDRRTNVATVARRLGVDHWFAGLTPQEKIACIQAESAGHRVLMVGDGLNDAPSLAAAHASMAPANAMDISRASADFVYTRPSLLAVPFAMRLSGAANRIVRQNFAIAILYNCIAVPLAMAGHVTPLVAAIAMSASSIIVVSNSMRLSLFGRIGHANEDTSVKFAKKPSLPVLAREVPV